MQTPDKILLILDLDETLIHSSEAGLAHPYDFYLHGFHVYKRPGLDEFLQAASELFEIAIWSSASRDYVEALTSEILPPSPRPAFIWCYDRCITVYDTTISRYNFIKDLERVVDEGFSLSRTLIVDDSPEKVSRNGENAVFCRPFLGDGLDDELPQLLNYLRGIHNVPDVRAIEKSGWRDALVNQG